MGWECGVIQDFDEAVSHQDCSFDSFLSFRVKAITIIGHKSSKDDGCHPTSLFPIFFLLHSLILLFVFLFLFNHLHPHWNHIGKMAFVTAPTSWPYRDGVVASSLYWLVADAAFSLWGFVICCHSVIFNLILLLYQQLCRKWPNINKLATFASMSYVCHIGLVSNPKSKGLPVFKN